MLDNSKNQRSEVLKESSDFERMTLENGATIEVWAEQYGAEKIALKIHVHASDGTLYKEEHESVEDGSTVGKALAHGVDHAKRIAGGAFGVPDADSPQATPI